MEGTSLRVEVHFWTGDMEEGVIAELEVERDEMDPTKVAIHTYINGEGSKTSYYLDREGAINFASAILEAVVLR